MNSDLLFRNTLGVLKIKAATSFLRRATGLLGYARLEQDEGMFIAPCSDVHTWFMRFPIDVVFLNSANVVLEVKDAVKPFKFVFGPKGTTSVLELAAGAAVVWGIKRNDKLVFE